VLPNTDAASANSMMLPLFPGMTDEQQDYVIDRVAGHVTALAA
jgi:perosamine synthetase